MANTTSSSPDISRITDLLSILETSVRFLPDNLSDEKKTATSLHGIELFAQDLSEAARNLREGTTAGKSEVQG